MTDIVDRIRQVALALGWRFTYGEQDIKNLIEAAQSQDLVPDEVHLMLLPVVRTPVTNEYGGISQINYELAFSIFTPDDFDILVEDSGKEYYWQKFDYKVKPMLTAYYYLHRNLICPGVVLQCRRITEIYNDGTENLTGIFIEATASIDVDSRLGEIVPVPPLPPIPTLCELLADCEVFKSLEQRVTALEAITPEDLISSDSGNQLTTGTDGGLYVPATAGGGLTCEDLDDCEVIQALQQDVQSAQGTAGSALSTANAAYPATNPSGFQTSEQVTASILPLLPLVSYYGDAGHTGDTNETIVLTFAIQPEQWLNKAMYQVICDCTRSVGSVRYSIYLNTSPVISGGILVFLTSGVVSLNAFRHFMVDGTSISHTDGVGTTATDINSGNNATRLLSTLDRSVPIFVICTIQGNTNAANGSFNNIQIGLV